MAIPRVIRPFRKMTSVREVCICRLSTNACWRSPMVGKTDRQSHKTFEYQSPLFQTDLRPPPAEFWLLLVLPAISFSLPELNLDDVAREFETRNGSVCTHPNDGEQVCNYLAKILTSAFPFPVAARRTSGTILPKASPRQHQLFPLVH